jgi:hypothetical protein
VLREALDRLAHVRLLERTKAEESRWLAALTRLSVSMLRLAPSLGLPHPKYRNGIATHALQRGHFAVTRPETRSTRRIAFLTTISPGPGTTILVAQTWQRVTAPVSTADAAMAGTVE